MIRGFEPIAGLDARVLVLGSLPSRISLEHDQYYAHPRNSFWPIMEQLFAEGAELDYPARAAMLVRARVAVWDVLQQARRDDSSLDSAIDADSEVANDIAGFLRAHPQVTTVFFNGAKAESAFRRHSADAVRADRHLTYRRLPSTSPANAGLSVEAKLNLWREVARVAEAGSMSNSSSPSASGDDREAGMKDER